MIIIRDLGMEMLLFVLRFRICIRGVGCGFWGFVGFLWDKFRYLIFEGLTFKLISIILFLDLIFRCQKISPKPQNLQNDQDYSLTKHEVLWMILKLTKILDQGMELGVFVVCFGICVGGVWFKLRVGFLRF